MTYSILASKSEMLMSIVQLLPAISLILGALIGFATGIRKMPRAGVAWMVAASLYSVILGVLQGVLGDGNPVLPVIVATIACAIVAVAFFMVTKILFYPHDKDILRSDIQKILQKEDKFRQIEKEEMEELRRDREADEDDFERLERRQLKRRKRYLEKMDGKTSFISRVVAAIIVGVDMMFVASVLIEIGVLFVASTPLAGKVPDLFGLESFQEILANAEKTALDYVIIGAFMFAVVKGYESGMLNAIYNFVSSIASIVAFAIGFYIPFSPIGAAGGKLAFTEGIANKVVGMIQPKLSGFIPIAIPETVYSIIGKVAVGCIYTAVLMVIMWFVTRTLRKAVDASYSSSAVRVFDGCFGVILGVITCVIVVAAGFFAFLLIEKIGWYSASENLFSGTKIFEILYAEFSKLAGGIAEKIAGIIR